MKTKSKVFTALLGMLVVSALIFLAPTLLSIGGATGPFAADSGQQWQIVGECRETSDTSVNITLFNDLNETASELLSKYSAITGYYYIESSPLVFSGTLSTGTATTVDCGYNYVLKFAAQKATHAQTGLVTELKGATCTDCGITDDDNFRFRATSANYAAQIDVHRKSLIETRVYDIDNDAYVYMGANQSNSTDATATNTNIQWNESRKKTGLTDITWTTCNITSNGSKAAGGMMCGLDVGAGKELNYRIEIRANRSDGNVNDRGIIVAIDATTATWNIPVVQFDGVTLSNIKGSELEPGEARTYADYEYVYLVDKDILDDIHQINVKIRAIAGVDPTSGPMLLIGVRGNYVSLLDNTEIKIGTVTDDSSPIEVFAHYRYNLSVY